jgi:hypothetical protein
MADFESLLKQSLSGATDAYQAALLDLNEEVAQLGQAVSNVTHLPYSLKLERISERFDGTAFDLCMGSEQDKFSVCAFFLPSRGYPISVGVTVTPHGVLGGAIKPLNNKGELTQFLSDLVSNPDSPLVLRIAFFLRQLKDRTKK